MAITVIQESLLYSVYLAPSGYRRLLTLGNQIAQRYLSPMDKLIGFIGDAGAGKSLLIKGMFPGLEVTNDDNGVNIRPLPILDNVDSSFFSSHTYHLDIRFESAFTQMHELSEAILKALRLGKRVIVEHFDLIYPYLEVNADILVGVGEQVIVTRPSVYGPVPDEIHKIVAGSGKRRKMSHSAEELTCYVLEHEYGIMHPQNYNEVLHGFVLEFDHKPGFHIEDLEQKVKRLIDMDVAIDYHDESHILIDGQLRECTGPRIHLKSAGEIKDYYLFKEFHYDPLSRQYTLVGTVGQAGKDNKEYLNKIRIL